MVGMLDSSVVGQGFKHQSGQTKDVEIGICCFSSKHPARWSKSKNWLARNQNNLSEWSDVRVYPLTCFGELAL